MRLYVCFEAERGATSESRERVVKCPRWFKRDALEGYLGWEKIPENAEHGVGRVRRVLDPRIDTLKTHQRGWIGCGEPAKDGILEFCRL